MGRVRTLWLKRFRRGPMDRVASARMDPRSGIEGNADCSRKRQVTLISAESWADAERALGHEVDPSLRRANLLLEGIELVASRGKTLQIGDVSIRVWGETRPCRTMEEACPGLQAALDPEWRGGVYGEILSGGEVREGDSVRLIEAASTEAFTTGEHR